MLLAMVGRIDKIVGQSLLISIAPVNLYAQPPGRTIGYGCRYLSALRSKHGAVVIV